LYHVQQVSSRPILPGILGCFMFERYTEQASRVIFFARYATSELGAECIETEHLLLGLLREDPALVKRFLRPGDSIDAVRRDIEKETIRSEKKIAASLDLPLSAESKRVLAYAAEESEKLSHWNIGVVHLLLGLFRVESCIAARILQQHKIDPSIIHREFRAENLAQSSRPPHGFVPDAETAERIAEAVCIPIFGQNEVEKQRPFQAELEQSVWVVKGSPKEGSTGNTMVVRISKADGSILLARRQS